MEARSEGSLVDAELGSVDHAGALAEYGALRAEIRHYLERRQGNRRFAYLLSLGVLGSDFLTSVASLPAPLFVVPPLLLASLWADDVRRLKAVQRLATYLRVVVEPSVPGLRYETLGLMDEVRLTPGSRVLANSDYPILFSSLSALCVWNFLESTSFAIAWPVVITAIALVLLVVTFFAGRRQAKEGPKLEEARWRKAMSLAKAVGPAPEPSMPEVKRPSLPEEDR